MDCAEKHLRILNLQDVHFYEVKCNLTELTTKCACIPIVFSGVFDMCIHRIPHAPGRVGSLHRDSILFYSERCFSWEHIFKYFPSLPSLFPPLIQCDGSPLLHGAHGSVSRICQPWEWSPSGSWLPIGEAPGCLRHPTSI